MARERRPARDVGTGRVAGRRDDARLRSGIARRTASGDWRAADGGLERRWPDLRIAAGQGKTGFGRPSKRCRTVRPCAGAEGIGRSGQTGGATGNGETRMRVRRNRQSVLADRLSRTADPTVADGPFRWFRPRRKRPSGGRPVPPRRSTVATFGCVSQPGSWGVRMRDTVPATSRKVEFCGTSPLTPQSLSDSPIPDNKILYSASIDAQHAAQDRMGLDTVSRRIAIPVRRWRSTGRRSAGRSRRAGSPPDGRQRPLRPCPRQPRRDARR